MWEGEPAPVSSYAACGCSCPNSHSFSSCGASVQQAGAVHWHVSKLSMALCCCCCLSRFLLIGGEQGVPMTWHGASSSAACNPTHPDVIDTLFLLPLVFGRGCSRPTIPLGVVREIRVLMEACWAQNPKSRPRMDAVVAALAAAKVLVLSSNNSNSGGGGGGSGHDSQHARGNNDGYNAPLPPVLPPASLHVELKQSAAT